MNKLNTTIVSTLIVLIMFFFLGRLFFLAGIQKELEQSRNQLTLLRENESKLSAELEKLKKNLRNEPVENHSNRLIKPGEETSILQFILANAGGGFKLNNYELMPSFKVKPAEDEADSMPAMNSGSETMPQLDENGNPVGMYEETDEEPAGVEIVPVRFTFSTTHRTLGAFLSETEKKLAMNAVRQMDLLLKDTGTVKGTLILNFPVAETGKK